ncbi:MAG: dynamin family protein [Chthoniobacteraceae bacterium]
MIGDEYLQVRAQLGTALFSLSTVAHGLEMGRDVLQSLHDIRASLREPFLFILLGNAKSGKTSLANALFGQEMLPTGAQTAEDKVHLFKYGPEEKTVQINDHLIEYQHPGTVLRDFNIVDTPGILHPEKEAVIRQFLPATELVLFVFSINDPWEPSAWELLKTIGMASANNVIFVLQQCDLRDDFEVNAVTRHLEQTLHEKFSPDCRIFPVSAKKAFLSKTTGTDREGLLQQSGFSALESYINDTVTQSDARKERLRHICRTGQALLAEAGEKNKETLACIKKEIEQLSELKVGLEERKEQSFRQINGILWTLAQSYERLQKHGEQLLQQFLPVQLMPKFTVKPPQEKIPQSLDEGLQESIQRQIQSAIELLAADLQKVLRQVYESTVKRFPTAIEGTYPGEFIQDRMELLLSIQSTLTDNMSEVHLQWQMTEFFTETAEWLQIHRDAGPNGVTTALACFVAGDFSRALAGAAASAGSISGLMKRGKIQMQFRAEMAHHREELLAAMETHLRRATSQFYKEAGESLQPLQVFHTAQKTIYEARTAMVAQIRETFGQTERGLG